IEHWGDVDWSTFYSAYRDATNLAVVSADDAPDLTGVTDLRYAFKNTALSDDSNLNDWDLGDAEDIRFMFQDAADFNSDITGWDVHNVKRVAGMFNGASSFNQAIGTWQTTSLEKMISLFKNASSFNQDISSWDVSGVTTMESTFSGAAAFSQGISSWDTGNVTDMKYMFEDAVSFDQDLPTNGSQWDVSKVSDMRLMFSGATAFDGDITNWDVGAVKNMTAMFEGATVFNRDISVWNVHRVTNMRKMFRRASGFDQNLGDWDLTSLKRGENLFDYSGMSCVNYSKTLQGWADNLGNTTPDDIQISSDGLEYSHDIIESRSELVDVHGWVIHGDAQGSCRIGNKEAYITVWETGYPGVSDPDQIRIPARGDFTYSWEELSPGSATGTGIGSGATTITFPEPGRYRVEMIPDW